MTDAITRERLIDAGASTEVADALLEIMKWDAFDAAMKWQQAVGEVFTPAVPFAVHERFFRHLAERWDPAFGPMPAYRPGGADYGDSRLWALMKEKELAGVDAFHRWTVEHRESYWETVTAMLGIPFRTPPQRVLDSSDGATRPRWFPGARLNIAEACFQAPGEATAIVYRRGPDKPLRRMTYAELDAMSNRVANGLIDAGFARGDALAIDMTMTAESVCIYLGIVKAGRVAISIADSFSSAEIAARLRIGGAKGIFTMDFLGRGGKRLPMYEKVVAADAPRAIVLPLGDTLDCELRPGDLAWSEFLADDETFQPLAGEPGDSINILFSSGTTGDPKAIPWDHTTPVKCAADGMLHHNIHPGDVVAWPTNLGWMMGPWLIFASLINRATIALYYDAPTGEPFCRFVRDAGVAMLGVVPSLVRAWRQADATAGIDWRAIRAFSSTGECSNASDMLYLMSRAGYRPVIEYCGGTEIGGGYLTATTIQPAAPATFTTPAFGLDLVLLDEAGQPAEVGEGFLAPPSIGLSRRLLNKDHDAVYYRDTPRDPEGRSLRRHGDQIERLPGGFFRALGRADDTMNLGGIKVSSAEIERVTASLPGVETTAAIAVAPEGGGPGQLVLFAVLAADASADEPELAMAMQQAIRGQLNPLFKLHRVRVVSALPRTASGKVMRRLLRQRYQETGSDR